MMDLVALIPHVKALHIGMLLLWCAGLFALPVMLTRHDAAIGQEEYARVRRATHFTYTMFLTPAAVLAIASGTALIFLREVFELWLFVKLVGVALLVSFHVWLGYVLVHVAERAGPEEVPHPGWPLVILVGLVLGLLALVLTKPELNEIPMPGWLSEPRGVQLPFDVPRR